MLKNLIKTAVRHIRKHYGYSILNILGLTLGISSALFLIIYVSDEVSYDRYHENADRSTVYRRKSPKRMTSSHGMLPRYRWDHRWYRIILRCSLLYGS
jgi:hypothetical protein